MRFNIDINPEEIINGLIEAEVGPHGTVWEEDGKFYSRSSIKKTINIPKEKYEYVRALEIVKYHKRFTKQLECNHKH